MRERNALIDEMLPLCREWTKAARLFAQRHSERHRLDPERYARVHARLLRLARQGAASPGPHRELFAEYAELTGPWMSLDSMDWVEREVLRKVVQRCEQIERALGGRLRLESGLWLGRGLALLVGGVVLATVAVWLPRAPTHPLWRQGRRMVDEVTGFWGRAPFEQQALLLGGGVAWPAT